MRSATNQRMPPSGAVPTAPRRPWGWRPGASLGLMASLALPLPAQDHDVATPAPIVRVLSRDLAMLRQLAVRCGAEPAELSLARADQCGEFVLRQDRGCEQRVSSSPLQPGCHSEFMVRPAGCVAAWADDIAAGKARAGAGLGLWLQQSGFPLAAGKQLVDELLELLPQIGGVFAQVEGDPQRPGAGLVLRLDLVPEPGTPFRHWLDLLAPSRTGVPQLPGTGGVLDLQLSLDAEVQHNLLQPFLDFAALYGTVTSAQQQQSADWLDRMAQAWDGSFACRFDGDRLAVVLGLRDTAAYAKVLADAQHLEQQQRSAAQRHVDLEFTPKALTHRGCELLKTVASGGVPSALLPRGELTSYAGVAGDVALTVGGTAMTEAAARAAVDDAVDGRLARKPLTGTDRGRSVPALLRLDLDLDRLPGFDAALAALPEAARPHRARLLLYRAGITLKLIVELR